MIQPRVSSAGKPERLLNRSAILEHILQGIIRAEEVKTDLEKFKNISMTWYGACDTVT